MEDRELLEFAAKAVRYDFAWYCRGANNPNGKPNVPFANGREWNPLKDDGDALRLAVELGLAINITPSKVYASDGRIDGIYETMDTSSPNATTRRAIVRAAAAIGAKNE